MKSLLKQLRLFFPFAFPVRIVSSGDGMVVCHEQEETKGAEEKSDEFLAWQEQIFAQKKREHANMRGLMRLNSMRTECDPGSSNFR
jgi:hypothetical protein